jgi:hypothetical protein
MSARVWPLIFKPVVGAAVASALVAATSIEALITDSFQREFSESIPRPAIFNDPRAVDCYRNGHLTTTAYLRTSNTTADLLVLYTTRDGLNVTKRSRRANVRIPAGRFSILSDRRAPSGHRRSRPAHHVEARPEAD